jgi:uncharacterized protein (DUF1810 family)
MDIDKKCKIIIDNIFNKAYKNKEILNQLIYFYYMYLTNKHNKNVNYYKSKLFEPIKRYITVLTIDEQNKIINDLKNPQKIKHWIWWGFPQEYGSWGNINVSEITKIYSMTNEECLLYILYYRDFYIKLLKLIITKKDLLYYFGNIDYKKFKSHIKFFKKNVHYYLNNDTELLILINTIISKNKL